MFMWTRREWMCGERSFCHQGRGWCSVRLAAPRVAEEPVLRSGQWPRFWLGITGLRAVAACVSDLKGDSPTSQARIPYPGGPKVPFREAVLGCQSSKTTQNQRVPDRAMARGRPGFTTITGRRRNEMTGSSGPVDGQLAGVDDEGLGFVPV